MDSRVSVDWPQFGSGTEPVSRAANNPLPRDKGPVRAPGRKEESQA